MKIFQIKKAPHEIIVYFMGMKIYSRRIYENTIKFDLKKYSQWITDLHCNKSLFVPLTNQPYQRKEGDVKIFTYYLTQFHAIPENDMAHGKGFTEWTNVASSTPLFAGHFQPKIPYDVGFYNLNNIDVMKRQAELAKLYGIYGFCFYYYWFSGKKVLEKPLVNFLHSDIDLPFHLCWANENWSKRWDGGNKEVFIEQKLLDDDAKKFFADILPFIQDKRYEKIDNKPILMIYFPQLFEKNKIKQFIMDLDTMAKEHGFDGFYFMSSNHADLNTLKEYGFNRFIEFPPHQVKNEMTQKKIEFVDPKCKVKIYNAADYINKEKYNYHADFTIFKCCFPSWDNTPRNAYTNSTIFEMADDSFEKWLTGIISWTKKNNTKKEQYVYINAWNEWAEGAILEPTTRYGYKNLETVKRCLQKNY